MKRSRWIPITFLALALLAAAPGLAEDSKAEAPEGVAAAFARGLFEGRVADITPMMTAQVKAAMTKAQTDQLRAALAAQNGAFKSAGAAWFEDNVQGFRRFRVPLEFANTMLDARVVLDGDDKVAGVFFVPHVERPDPADEPEAPVDEIDVEVGTPGLGATISRPAGDGPFPAVVLVHGSGPNDRDETVGPNKPFRDLAWGLAEQGVLVLRYDKRSFARPTDLAEAGSKLTVRDEVLIDAWAALELLRARSDTDNKRLYVLGHSLGGMLAPRIARQKPRPAGMIVLAGITLPLPEKMLEQTRYILGHSGNDSEAARGRVAELEQAVTSLRRAIDGDGPEPEGSMLGAPIGYYRDLEAHDAPALAARLGLPSLILQGRRDYQVTMRDFARWQQALSGKRGACLAVYDDLDHLFHKGSGPSTPADYERQAPVDPRVIRDIAAWIHGGNCPNGRDVLP